MFQSVLAVLGGFAAMALLVVVSTAIAAQLLIPGGVNAMRDPTAGPPPAYMTANLVCSGIAAFLGGFVTVRLAPGQPFYHAIALAALMCVMGVISARSAGKQQPAWYQVVLCTVMPGIALVGGYVSGQVGGLY